FRKFFWAESRRLRGERYPAATTSSCISPPEDKMRTTPKHASLLLTALAVFLFAQTSWSQSVYGNIVGTVEDSTGAIVPGAKVTITDVAKGTSNTYTTNDTGNFTATHLIPGFYNVRVEATNFKANETKNVQVFADQTVRLSPVLAAGGATETVE